jgi:signal transduction histidine kinase
MDTAFERVFRRRLIRGTTALLVVLGLLAAARNHTLGLPWMVAADLATLAVSLGNLVLLHRSDRADLCGHVSTTAVLVLLVLDNSISGGFYDPNFAWLYVVPVLGGLLVPGRAVVGYGVVVLAITVGFFALDELGPGVPDLIPPAEHAFQSLLNRITAIVALVGIVGAFGYERGRSSAAVARAMDEATAASRAKSEFLANTSHELRTPLNAIIGFSELLMEEAIEDGRSTDDLVRIRSAGRTLLVLINDVLDLSKIEAGRLEVVARPVELGPLLRELGANLATLVRQGGNEWVVDVPEDLGTVEIDGPRFGQIVTNLVGNAAKFTRGGRVRMSASRANGTIRVDIRDTGIGIPADKQAAVFESFVQVDGSTTRNTGGTGLGLPIARKLARLMGGDVVLESAPGEGSLFTVTVAERTVAEAPAGR